MLVAENVRSPGEMIVDIFVAVHIDQACAVTIGKVERYGGFGAHGAADAAGERLAACS